MFGKFVLLAIIGYTVGETCLSISGPCVLGMCPVGSCVANVCCVSDPAENCNNTMDEIFCTNHASACTDPTVGPQMKIVCARSCKSCNGAGTNSTGTPSGSPSGTCADKTTDCQQDKYLCNDATYKTVMQQQCPLTCGYCTGTPSGSPSGTPSSGACADKVNPATGTSDCPRNKSLCTNPNYKTLMQQQCPKTCGFC